MKFDCDRSRRAWQRKQALETERLQNWHLVFAWKPFRLSPGDCRWLEYYERRGTWCDNEWGDYWTWEYRAHEPFIGRQEPPDVLL